MSVDAAQAKSICEELVGVALGVPGVLGGILSAAGKPVPVRVTRCGLPVALLTMANDAEVVTAAEGVKRTLMVHDAAGGTGVAQLLPSKMKGELMDGAFTTRLA